MAMPFADECIGLAASPPSMHRQIGVPGVTAMKRGSGTDIPIQRLADFHDFKMWSSVTANEYPTSFRFRTPGFRECPGPCYQSPGAVAAMDGRCAKSAYHAAKAGCAVRQSSWGKRKSR